MAASNSVSVDGCMAVLWLCDWFSATYVAVWQGRSWHCSCVSALRVS